MITELVQTWNRGRASYEVAPPGERFDPHGHEVALIDRERVAKPFVVEHHYSHSFPAARFCYGLFAPGGSLVGVAVFSHPVHNAVLTNVFPCEPEAATDLGRFVLLQGVKKFGETWFLARCRELLRRAGILGHVAYSDPCERTTASGEVIMPGHVGGIYQASNAVFLGRARSGPISLLPDGTSVSPRALSKIRNGERSRRHAITKLERATEIICGRDVDAWLHAVTRTLRTFRHPGCLKYAFALDRRIAKHLPKSLPYMKIRRAA